MKFLNPFPTAIGPSRISPWVWGFLVLSTVSLFLALVMANLQFGLVAPGLLNPLETRELPERWGVQNDWIHAVQPVMVAVGIVLGMRFVPRRPWGYLLGSTLLTGFSLRYFIWRSTTLNTAHPFSLACSLALFLIEVISLFSIALQFYPSVFFDPDKRIHQANKYFRSRIKNPPSVDVYIPTYNESVKMVRRAVLACRGIDYPNKTIYILDDGRRPAMADLASELGVKYISRPDNLHRKAGNLNHALGCTQGELIAVFDCDFIPFKQFLYRTVGFFSDPNVGLIQTPQHYFNSDFHLRNLGLDFLMPSDLDSFFHYNQVVRDRFNAVICCGTSYVVRRQALASVGGYYTKCIVEDYQTGTSLEIKGWRVVYLDEILSLGEVPRTFRDYLDQRLRWLQGNVQIYFCWRDLPIWTKLGVWQKSFFISQALYCFMPLFRAGYIILPLLSFVIGFSLIAAPPSEYLFYGLPFTIILHGILSWQSNSHYSQLWTEIYESLFCFPALGRLTRMIGNPMGHIGSLVTNKDVMNLRQSMDIRLAWPLLAYLVIFSVAMFARYGLPLINPAWMRSPFEGEEVMLAWNAYNALIIFICLLACIDRPVRRRHDRFPLETIARLRIGGQEVWGVTQDVSESGLTMALTDRVVSLDGGDAMLDLPQSKLTLPSKIVRQSSKHGYPVLGLEFHLQSVEQEEALIRLLYNETVWFQKLNRVGIVDSFLILVGSVWRAEPLVRRFR
ncbi:glycosyltransferase [Cyanobium gracile]|uniref:cellulose synthase (UDP-forming) n=1 Tax=Cyanobium gracile UHCC 0281 TaxID=3110309 RepID=A0ABU5SSR7_9CYAN|nr:glycosyltransferase [Cyanobium gracile]MEA5441563.1 glycosyltransferase [Cyanobium gracile UHCC 0281]